MGLMSSLELDLPSREQLLRFAYESIQHGLEYGRALRVDVSSLPDALREPRATFVTLKRDGELRGCIGVLEAYRPLAVDVAENAYAAAFRDPRFPRLTRDELGMLSVSISILSPPTELHFVSEEDLLAQIRPGVDGLILQEGQQRGTFLPSVWDSLPDRVAFLSQLKVKAGLPPTHWSEAIRVWRYETESV